MADVALRVPIMEEEANVPIVEEFGTQEFSVEDVVVEDYVSTDDDEDEGFLVDEKNEIVDPNVDVHLFGISMDLPFDNIGVTNLVSGDVLEGEDVDVINGGMIVDQEIKHCTYKLLSEKIFDQVRVNPDIPVKAVQDQLQRDLEVQISMSKAFKAKAKAEKEIRGDHVLQYSMLRDYVVELQSTNPNTTVKIVVERNTDPFLPTKVFQSIYVCLGALKLGFRDCRRDLLGLDGDFMKGPFPGQVLSDVGLDSNNGIYPLAYALVEAESKSSWCWFLQCLGDDIHLHPNSNFTFIVSINIPNKNP
ncbi:transposase, MuDR, MULE transposase domain protein [Tanacetum coccineum]